MVSHIDKCIDPRGSEYLEQVFQDIAVAMGVDTVTAAIEMFAEFYENLDLEIPSVNNGDYKNLTTSVNIVRLKNNPIRLDENAIDELYHQILLNK